MASALLVHPRHAARPHPEDKALADLCDGRCTVTLSLDEFHEFTRRAMRFDGRLPFRVIRDVGRPIELMRLLFGDDLDRAGAPARLPYLAARDGGMHLQLRMIQLEWMPDRSFAWIFSSGFAVSGPRRPLDIASFLNFRAERIRWLKPKDLDDCLAGFARITAVGTSSAPPDIVCRKTPRL